MSEKDVIFYVADESNPLPEIVKQTLLQEGYPLKAYQPDTPLGQTFFIFSPIWDGKYYQSVESVWEKFLAKNFPDSKLLVIGSLPGDDPNYTDAFNLPKDWGKTIAALPPASRFTGKAPVFTNGLNMEERLRRFLMGHGDDSLAEVCKKLYPYLNAANEVLTSDCNPQKKQEIIIELGTGHAKNLWDTLHLRWINHQHIFNFLPFPQTFQELADLMNELEHVFEENESTDTDYINWTAKATPALHHMRNLLNELQAYV